MKKFKKRRITDTFLDIKTLKNIIKKIEKAIKQKSKKSIVIRFGDYNEM